MMYALTAVVVVSALAPLAALSDPFAFLHPTAVFGDREERRLAGGEVIVRTVGSRPRDVTLVSAVRIAVDGVRLTSWYRSIAELRRSSYVPEIGRFSDPPRLEDLDGLTIERVDVDELRRCRPADCGLKLRPAEITELQRSFTQPRSEQQEAISVAFRRVVLARAQEYLRRGRDDGPPPPLFLSTQWPQLSNHITQYPRASTPEVESFLYWSKEHVSGKPIVSATHVTIARAESPQLPSPIIVSRQVFATHYLDGLWGVTTIAQDEGTVKYLVYVNQSEVDLLGGIFGGLVRSAIERQLKSRAGDLLEGVRRRLEGGDPPSSPVRRD